MNSDDSLIDAIRTAADNWLRSQSRCATVHDLEKLEKKIMAFIDDYIAAQTTYNDRVDTAVTGLQGDVQFLNEQIAVLSQNQGGLTPEQVTALTTLQTRGQVVADKLEALDALTPPKPPPHGP